MRPAPLLQLGAVSVLGAASLTQAAYVCSNTTAAGPAPGPITSTQPLGNSSAYVGAPFAGNKLTPKLTFEPHAALLHGDGGTTGSSDYAGALGANPVVKAVRQVMGLQLWGDDGTLTTATVNPNTTTAAIPQLGLAAMDPTTLVLLDAWFPPEADGEQNFAAAYMEMRLSDKMILAPTIQGQIYAVQRTECPSGPQLHLERSINVSSYLAPGETVLNSMFDVSGNIWFSSGFILNTTSVPQPSATVGYITPEGQVYTLHIADQMVENGIAVSGERVFMVTGPSNTSTNDTGYMWSFCAGSGPGGVETRWKAPYDSGPGIKNGAFSRGSGTTPELLGDDYVTITDNASPQLHLVVFHQDPLPAGRSQVFCTNDVFEPYQGSNDASPTTHFDAATGNYGVTLFNQISAPNSYRPTTLELINGPGNNMSAMPGGVVRVDVDPRSGCSTRWYNKNITSKSTAVLSTASGLFYYTVQDRELANQGTYVWYFAALDWDTGDEVWRVRTGTGGLFNDMFFPASVGPGGVVYQTVTSGVISLVDGSVNGSSKA